VQSPQDVAIEVAHDGATQDSVSPVVEEFGQTKGGTESSNYLYQIWVLIQRGFRKDLRGVFTWISILETILVAVICGILWFQSMNKFEQSRLKNSTGLIFFTVTHWGFYPMFVSLGSFPEESLVIAKERSSKTYGGSFWILLTSVAVAQSIGVFISALSPTFQKGASTLTVFMLTTMLAAGFYVSPIPSWISWVKWLSFLQYSYGAYLQIYFLYADRYFVCSSSECDVMTGEETLASVGHFLPFWANVLCLYGMFILVRLCTYMVLRFGKRLTLSN